MRESTCIYSRSPYGRLWAVRSSVKVSVEKDLVCIKYFICYNLEKNILFLSNVLIYKFMNMHAHICMANFSDFSPCKITHVYVCIYAYICMCVCLCMRNFMCQVMLYNILLYNIILYNMYSTLCCFWEKFSKSQEFVRTFLSSKSKTFSAKIF